MSSPRATVAHPGETRGVGVHTGKECVVRILPADPETGLVFRREGTSIPADIDAVSSTSRRTALGRNNKSVDTVEHLLAALFGAEIHDAIIDVDGPELPIGDGSAVHFSDLIGSLGRLESGEKIETVTGTEAFEITDGDSVYRYAPSEEFTVEVEIHWDHPLIGHQRFRFGPGQSFREDLSGARTFILERDVETLRANGLLLGGTLDSGIVLTDTGLAQGALRWPDEFVRHKTLDLLGDLTLLGYPVLGDVRAIRPSHRGNVSFARAFRERLRENAA
jgi:UDP-3-O-[3-hydroxymyristoyl] N-acetylglucosamine deacetylase